MHATTLRRTSVALALVGSLGVVLGGCATNSPEPSSPAAAGAVDLAAAGCPSTVVIQTDWLPEAEHGMYYELLGPDPEIDSNLKAVTGPLYSRGKPTGVNLQIRAGGPAIGFQTTISALYADPDITLGYSNTDDQIAGSEDMPTVAVVAPTEIDPRIILWDPATYPDVDTIADLGKTDAFVRYFGGSAWMDYLVGSGTLRADQVDAGFDGTPANFVAADGKDAQQGFVTYDPYYMENMVDDWAKPIAYQKLYDTGYQIYAYQLTARADDLDELSPCLKELVPVVQQATIDYFADPTQTNEVILDAVTQFSPETGYTMDLAEFSDATQISEGIVGNGNDNTVGNFDPDRVSSVFDIALPILTKTGLTPPPGLTPEDLYTNEFIDESIGF
jgi:hypothetical protein